MPGLVQLTGLPPPRCWARYRAPLIVVAVAALKFLLTVMVSGRYGFHRDEFYYLASARHLALGYVDFPPLTPILARLDMAVSGVSLVGLRLLPALTGAVLVILSAGIARNLGGGGQAQVLAALTVMLNPLMLSTDFMFQTVVFDQLTWLAVLYLVVLWMKTRGPRLWFGIGLAFGIGLETKYTIVALGIGLGCGLLLSPERSIFRTPWPWLGASVALLLLVPNLVWQTQHGWVSLAYIHEHSGHTGSRLDFVVQTLLFLGPMGLPAAVLAGQFLSKPRWRLFAWTVVGVMAFLFVTNGKPYYAGPLYPLVLAAGAVRAEQLFRQRYRLLIGITAALAVVTIPLVPLGLPVLPASTAIDMGVVAARTDYEDMFGWEEMTAQVASVYRALPPGQRHSTIILAGNYGEAGALELYGARYALPPVISPHLTYFYWKPKHLTYHTVIAVGFSRKVLSHYFSNVRQVAQISNVYGVRNDEYGGPIFLCRRPRVDLNAVWPSLQQFD